MKLGYRGVELLTPEGHVGLFYHNVDKAIAIVAKIAAEGLKEKTMQSGRTAKDSCLFCGPASFAERLCSYLRLEGVVADAEIEAGNLRIVVEREEIFEEGVFDPDIALAAVHGFIKHTAEGEKRPARIIGDISWLTEGEQMLEFEKKGNELFSSMQDIPVISVCMYSLEKLTCEELFELAQLHPAVILGEELMISTSH